MHCLKFSEIKFNIPQDKIFTRFPVRLQTFKSSNRLHLENKSKSRVVVVRRKHRNTSFDLITPINFILLSSLYLDSVSEDPQLPSFVEASAVTSVPDREDSVASVVVESPVLGPQEEMTLSPETCGNLAFK